MKETPSHHLAQPAMPCDGHYTSSILTLRRPSVLPLPTVTPPSHYSAKGLIPSLKNSLIHKWLIILQYVDW